MLVSAMFRTLAVMVIFSALAPKMSQERSKAPDSTTLTRSLKTMGKALAGCRASYVRVQHGSPAPLVKAIIGGTDYEKDMASLSHAETFVNTMAAHPEKVTGKNLVAALSSTDDFYAGVGSTRLAILSSLIRGKKEGDPSADEMLVASQSLADCQTALFNAGDDFVDLVMNYVGAEDDAVMAARSRRP